MTEALERRHSSEDEQKKLATSKRVILKKFQEGKMEELWKQFLENTDRYNILLVHELKFPLSEKEYAAAIAGKDFLVEDLSRMGTILE